MIYSKENEIFSNDFPCLSQYTIASSVTTGWVYKKLWRLDIEKRNTDIDDKKENLEATMLSEINKAQKDKYYITLLECESGKAKLKSEEWER